MPSVTRPVTRKSIRHRNPPERLRSDSPERTEQPVRPIVVSPPVHKLMTASPTVLVRVEEPPQPTQPPLPPRPNSPQPPQPPPTEKHPSDNYTRMDLYQRWISCKTVLSSLREEYNVQSKELKAAHKEITYYERKMTVHEVTAKKLSLNSQAVHQLKLDKKYWQTSWNHPKQLSGRQTMPNTTWGLRY